MARHLQKISISFTLSCLLSEFGYGTTPCQNGYDYNNRCDPYYNINLIKAKVSNDKNMVSRQVIPIAKSTTKLENLVVKAHGVQRQSDLSYLDSLRKRYSKQFDGNMGLQALIDRSKYLELKKIDKEEPKANEVVKTPLIKTNAKEVSKAKITFNQEISTKSTKKNITSSLSSVNNEINKSKIVTNKKIVKAKKAKKTNIYVVKKGDNLIKIAKKFSLNKKALLSLNKLDKNATIKIGQKLILPSKAKLKTLLTKKKSKKKSNVGIYIVKKGDTLSLIARKNNISLTTLRELNKLSRSSKIKIGQKLVLSPSKIKRVKSNDYDIVKNIKFEKVPSLKYKRKIRVVATAYTSHRNQTDKTPFLAAWNNRLRPGMKIIAVSPDLIKKYGLTNGVKVKILGLPGYYVVRDKMNARLRNHIDIYMGVNKRRALQWGRKRIVLYW